MQAKMELIVRRVGYLPELYEDAQSEKYFKKFCRICS